MKDKIEKLNDIKICEHEKVHSQYGLGTNNRKTTNK